MKISGEGFLPEPPYGSRRAKRCSDCSLGNVARVSAGIVKRGNSNLAYSIFHFRIRWSINQKHLNGCRSNSNNVAVLITKIIVIMVIIPNKTTNTNNKSNNSNNEMHK